jgi:hypothetical protein
LTDG